MRAVAPKRMVSNGTILIRIGLYLCQLAGISKVGGQGTDGGGIYGDYAAVVEESLH